MSIRKRLLIVLALILWLVPEILFSPALQIYYNFFTNGKILRGNHFINSSSFFFYSIFVVQLIGTVLLATQLEGWKKMIMIIISTLIALALLLAYSLSYISL